MSNIEHSKLPPSSASRRMACPGSRALSEKYARNEESESSKEGTLAHELAANSIARNRFIGMHPSYTEEMHDGAKAYKEVVLKFFPDEIFEDSIDVFFVPNKNIRVEQKVDITNVHADMWGTPDAWGVDIENNVLHVFDYKFGFTPVDAFENWQLIAYACGTICGYPSVSDIYLHIVQPRDYISSSKHKMWHLTSDELERYRKRLVTSEALTMSPNAELKVNAECKYCPARHACPALRESALGAAELTFRGLSSTNMTPEQIGNELKLLHDAQELLSFYVTGLETQAKHLLQTGKNIPHYELASTSGRLSWNVDTKQVLELGILLGVDLGKVDVLTPTQAIKKGVNEETVLKYSERKMSLKLSKVDVKKPQEVFGKNGSNRNQQ